MLDIRNLHISVDSKEIVKGLNLSVNQGEVHAIMGPNGSGKSTLAYTLAGHPRYHISDPTSQVFLDEESLLDKSPNQRAKLGLFLAFQYPVAIPGVTVMSFLRQTYQALYPEHRLPLFQFREIVEKEAGALGIKQELLNRSVNEGFSGGEKKRVEILQLRILKPKYAICDETDSGLDVDALKTVALGIREATQDNLMGCLVITHYQRILEYLKPDVVHVMVGGKIAASGGNDLINLVEDKGYKQFMVGV